MPKSIFAYRFLALLVTLCTTGYACADPATDGMAIARDADARAKGWQGMKATAEMILHTAEGQTSRRKLKIKSLEDATGEDRSLTVFIAPRDVKGTALLTHSHTNTSDDQWLYLPIIKRVKRIASANKSGPFLGSEFAFEDFSDQALDKFTYTLLGEEELAGRLCYKLERVPVSQDSGYTRQVAWLDKEHLRTWQVDYYDRRNALLKTLTASDFELLAEKFWRPGKLLMTNHQSGKKTEMLWSDQQMGLTLTAREFDKSALKRAR